MSAPEQPFFMASACLAAFLASAAPLLIAGDSSGLQSLPAAIAATRERANYKNLKVTNTPAHLRAALPGGFRLAAGSDDIIDVRVKKSPWQPATLRWVNDGAERAGEGQPVSTFRF